MATIRDVAQLARVSTSTVSHVINGTRYVSPEVQERVLTAMQDLHYQHNRLASSLRHQRTHTLGVLLPNSDNPFFARVLVGIEKACYKMGYNIIIGNANDDPERELAYLQVLLSRQVDGIVLTSTGAYEKSIDLLERNQIPVVMVDRSANLSRVDEIFTANEDGGLQAAEYLLHLGHRRIAIITGASHLTPSAKRVEGYRRALHLAGVTLDESLVARGDFSMESGYQAGNALISRLERPTAIFACNDLMAVGAICAAHEAGLHVPQDLSVIGYDDIPLASYTVPRLTTIAQPSEQIGHLAVERLLARIANPTLSPQHDMLPVELIIRDSCSAITDAQEVP